VNWDRALHTRPGIMRLELPRATMRVRAVSGSTHTVVFAADPPIVLEHYDELIARLAPRASVVCLELPGFGFSLAKRDFSFSFAEYAEVVTRTLVELDCRQAILAFPCAWSYLAMAVAHAVPGRVRALGFRRPLIGQTRHDGPTAWTGAAPFNEKAWGRSRCTSPERGPPSVGSNQPSLRAAIRSLSYGRRLDAFDQGASFSLATLMQTWFGSRPPVLPRSALPGFMTWGAKDRSHEQSRPRSFLEHAPHLQWIESPHCGHFPELEDAARYSNAVHALFTPEASLHA
jgi:pimeloyl-ACP methyl ester carboxylesterase